MKHDVRQYGAHHIAKLSFSDKHAATRHKYRGRRRSAHRGALLGTRRGHANMKHSMETYWYSGQKIVTGGGADAPEMASLKSITPAAPAASRQKIMHNVNIGRRDLN